MPAELDADGNLKMTDPGQQIPPIPPPTNTPPMVPVGFFTQEQLDAQINAERERVRKEEKDKLYGRLTEAEKRAKELEAAQAKRDEQEAALLAKQEADAKKAQEAEMTAKQLIDQREQEWQARFEAMEAQHAQERAIAAQERRYQELQTYKAQVIAANQDNILPHLRDPALVTGSSEEEINSSVERLVNVTAATLQDLGQLNQEQQRMAPGVSLRTPGGPESSIPTQRTYTPEQLANIPMSDWPAMRKQLGLDRNDNGNRGLFG